MKKKRKKFNEIIEVHHLNGMVCKYTHNKCREKRKDRKRERETEYGMWDISSGLMCL